MWSFGVSRRNSGSRWRSAVATTSSEGGIPGRTVRSQDPKEAQTSRGCATERYCSNPKMQAVHAHPSQFTDRGLNPDFLVDVAREQGRLAGVPFAEGFEVVRMMLT